MARRLVLGKFNDGVTIGVRCSLPGIDALTGDSSVGGFSFDSTWNDISQTLLVGTGMVPATGTLVINFTDQGYIPYVEVRKIVGNIVYDDGIFGFQIGMAAQVTNTTLDTMKLPSNTACLYVVHKIPVMSG